jgi:hypothetical protein
MPQITFTYTGTSPATVVTFQTGPDMGDFSAKKIWMSPRIRAAGGEDEFVYDKSIVLLFHTIHLKKARSADVAAFMTFLTAVDGISNLFNYADPVGLAWMAQIWNSEEIRAALVSHNRHEITIELLLVEPIYIGNLADGSHRADGTLLAG